MTETGMISTECSEQKRNLDVSVKPSKCRAQIDTAVGDEFGQKVRGRVYLKDIWTSKRENSYRDHRKTFSIQAIKDS